MNGNTKWFTALDFLLFICGDPTHCLYHNTVSSNRQLTALLMKPTQIGQISTDLAQTAVECQKASQKRIWYSLGFLLLLIGKAYISWLNKWTNSAFTYMQQPRKKHFYTLPVYGTVAHLVKFLSSVFTSVSSHIRFPSNCVSLFSHRAGSGPGTPVISVPDALKGTIISLRYYMSELQRQTLTP